MSERKKRGVEDLVKELAKQNELLRKQNEALQKQVEEMRTKYNEFVDYVNKMFSQGSSGGVGLGDIILTILQNPALIQALLGGGRSPYEDFGKWALRETFRVMIRGKTRKRITEKGKEILREMVGEKEGEEEEE